MMHHMTSEGIYNFSVKKKSGSSYSKLRLIPKFSINMVTYKDDSWGTNWDESPSLFANRFVNNSTQVKFHHQSECTD